MHAHRAIRALLTLVVAAAPAVGWAGPPHRDLNHEALAQYAAGLLLEADGRDAEALGAFARALSIDPAASSAARHISELSARLGEMQRSLEFADRTLTLDPADARAHWLRGTALFSLGRQEGALASLQAAVAADSGEVEYFRTLARVAEQLDRIDLLAATWRRVVDLDESDGEAWFQLAAAEARRGRFGRADTALTEAADLNPARPGLLFLKGWIEESTGHPKEAIALYRRHLGVHAADQATRRRLVNLLIAAKQYAEAYPEARTVTQARPEDPEALEIEADLALWTKRQTEATRLLNRLRATAPDDPSATGRAIGVLGRHGRHAEGAAMARAWAAAHPADARGPLLAMRAHLLAGAHPAAIASAREAVLMAPDSLGPRLALGRLLQSLKRFSSAESVWTETVARFPGHTAIELDAAYCREQLGDIEGSEEMARGVLARRPDDPTVLNFLGYLLADHDRKLDEAESLIRRALEHDPDNGAILDSMGWVYFRLGRLTEARGPLERAVSLTGGDPVVREHLGDVYKGLKLMDLARDQYRHALAADSANARVRAKLVETR